MTLKNILHLPSSCENDEWDSKSKQSIEYDLQLILDILEIFFQNRSPFLRSDQRYQNVWRTYRFLV